MSQRQYQRYLRSEGVTIGTGCDIYKPTKFGSEPWLIKLGNNVRITQGVNFITPCVILTLFPSLINHGSLNLEIM